MKKIILLITCILCFVSCSDDKEAEITSEIKTVGCLLFNTVTFESYESTLNLRYWSDGRIIQSTTPQYEYSLRGNSDEFAVIPGVYYTEYNIPPRYKYCLDLHYYHSYTGDAITVIVFIE